MNAITQQGFPEQSIRDLRRQAGMRFFRAWGQGRWRAVWHALTGRDSRLRELPHTVVMPQTPRSSRIVTVALSDIVGSMGRANDFDDTFNPRNGRTRGRWISIAIARAQGVALPPVELIQARDGFYVRDGHHRISVARASGQAGIDSRIIGAANAPVGSPEVILRPDGPQPAFNLAWS